MKVIKDAELMQRWALRMRLQGKRVALVPTMGALHRGHEVLIRKARQGADYVVVSLYVNPSQFGPTEDLSRYPRMMDHDRSVCRKLGVDVLFCPDTLYAKDSSTWVEEVDCSQGRCGAFRVGHFRGVATVVVKLFLICQPHVAYFGEKDAQQLDVIRRVVRDLYFPIKVVGVATVRDKDGVALSSRNMYLNDAERVEAGIFARLLKEAATKKDAVSWFKKNLSKYRGLSLEYVEIAQGRLCAAVYVGSTRLIDNVPIRL
jgi:pantoate--beta-alanine ligase